MTDISKSAFTPREIVSELDRHIVAQSGAKRAVAIALRNRWRRKQVPGALSGEITPKNILMIGPTGVGKTEISRRLAKLANAAAEGRILDALVGKDAGETTRKKFRDKLINGELDETEVELEMSDNSSPLQGLDIPGQPGGGAAMISLGSIFGKGRTKTVKMKIKDAHKPLLTEEADKILDEDTLTSDAVKLVEEDGIVFLDEIDKITARSGRDSGGEVSREGVQRDLLPLIEGTTVSTKYGPVKTDHILFIASGAFHVAKPSDMLPELQGRLPIRVELRALTEEDFVRILTEPEASLIKQYTALMATEDVTLERSRPLKVYSLAF